MAATSIPLDAWLDRNNAEQLWRTAIPSGTITGYSINGFLAVAIRHRDTNGWELLVPASRENNVVATLDAAAIALDCLGCRDLPGCT